MKWLKISLVLLLILIVANIFLGYNIIRQYVSSNYLNDDAVDNAVTLLNDAGIAVSSEQIPAKKPDVLICVSQGFDGAEDYYFNAAGTINGRGVSDSMTQHMINNGVRIIDSEFGEYFEFYENGFSFVYSKESDFSVYDKYISDAQLSNIDNTSSLDSELLDLVSTRLFGDNEKYSLKAISYAELNNTVCMKLAQYYDGLPLAGCEIVCVVTNGDIEYISGSLVLIDVESTYSADLIDALNIMFKEKEAYGQLTEGNNGIALESISVAYSPTFSSNMSEIYFVPSWSIKYVGNITNIRSMINGELCANQ